MKYEWRKAEKDIYGVKSKPQLADIPKQQFLTIKGQGNPNSPEFAEKIGALYALSYTLKMMPRKNVEIEGYFDYTVYPLEGTWTMPDDFGGGEINKDLLIYEIMIKQPEFITEGLVVLAKEMSKKKVEIELLNQVEFKIIEEDSIVQILHVGDFDSEYISFEKINEFCIENNLKRTSMAHKEIYLSDFRKVAPEKLKTILRVNIEKHTGN